MTLTKNQKNTELHFDIYGDRYVSHSHVKYISTGIDPNA